MLLIIGIPLTSFAQETEKKTDEAYFLEKLEKLEQKYQKEREELLEIYESNMTESLREIIESHTPDMPEIIGELLSKEDYGGIYGREGIIHIIPVIGKEEKIENMLSVVKQKTEKANCVVIDKVSNIVVQNFLKQATV